MTDLMTVGMRYLPGKYLAGTGLQVRMVLEMNGMSQLVTSNDFGEDLPCIAMHRLANHMHRHASQVHVRLRGAEFQRAAERFKQNRCGPGQR